MYTQNLKEAGNTIAANPSNVAYGVREVLQRLVSQASKTQEPLLSYRVNSSQSPAIQTLLSAAVSLAKNEHIGAGECI